MTSPFSLPESLVDDARQERSDSWLQTIAGDIDRQVKSGMRGLEQAARVAVEPLSPIQQALEQGGLKIPTLEELTPSWMRQEHEQKAAALAPILAGGVTVPSMADLTPGSTLPAGGRPQPMPTGAPPQTGDLRAYTRSKALSLGINPDIAERVFGEGEGGFDDPVRQSDIVYQGRREESYGPAQMNMSGGLGTALLRERGIDVRDPKNVYHGIDYALENAAKNGWGAFHGAARIGIGERQGIGVGTPGAAPAHPAARTPTPTQAGQSSAAAPSPGGGIRVVPAATPDSYWTSGGTHGGFPAADLFAPMGSPILAPVGGTISPDTYPKGGNAATMKGDDGRYYYFAHGNVPFQGGRVEAGQPIGQVGDTGNAKGNPHLHYAIATSPSVFDQRNGSGDITGEAYWKTPDGKTHSTNDGHNHAAPPPNAGVASPPAAPTGTPAAAAPPTQPAAGASPIDEARAQTSGGQDMQRMSLEQPSDEVPDDGGLDSTEPYVRPDLRTRGRFTPERNIVPLGPAMRGEDALEDARNLTPRGAQTPHSETGEHDVIGAPQTWFPPGTRNRAMPGHVIEEVGEGPEDPPNQYPNQMSDQVQYRQPLGQQPELPADEQPYDPDQGPREAIPGSEGASNLTPLGPDLPPISQAQAEEQGRSQSQQPALLPVWNAQGQVIGYRQDDASSPASPDRWAAAEAAATPVSPQQVVSNTAAGISRAATGLYEAAKEPQNAIDTIGAAAGAAGQAVVDEAYPTPEQQTANAGKLPMQRGLEVVQAALDAGGTEVGRRVGRAAGLSDEELFSVFGIPVSAEDIAGFAGSAVLDPTNYFGAAPAARTVRAVAEAAPAAVRRGVEAAAPIVRRGASLEDHVGTLAVKGLSDAQVADWSTHLSDIFPGWTIRTTRRLRDGVNDIEIISGSKTAYGGTPEALHTQMEALASEFADAGHGVDYRGLQPAQLDFIERADIEEIVRGGPRGASIRDQGAIAASEGGSGAAAALPGGSSGPEGRPGTEAGAAGRPAAALDDRLRQEAPQPPAAVDSEAALGAAGPSPGLRGAGRVFREGRETAARLNAEGGPITPGTLGAMPNDMEPRMRSEFGTRIEEVPDDIRGEESIRRVRAARDEEPSPPDTQVPPNFDQQPLVRDDAPRGGNITLNATTGTVPRGSGSGALATFNRAASEAIVGGTGGAVIEQGRNPDDPNAAARGFAAGAVGFPAATRLARAAARRAGRSTETDGALATLGARPGRPDPANPRWLRGNPIRMTEAEETERLRFDVLTRGLPPDVKADVDALIRASAEGQDWARTQRRGVLPDEVVQQMAADDAKSVDDLIKGGKAGKAYNAEQTVAIRNAVTSQASAVRELSQEIADAKAAGMTPDLLLARRAAESVRLDGLVKLAEGAKAEAGRAFRQYNVQARLIELNPDDAIARIRKKIGDPAEFVKIVDEYTKAVQEGADPIQMAKLWAKVEAGKITGSEVFALYRRFNMLSGPRTVEVNLLSGGINLAYEMLGPAVAQMGRGRFRETAAEIAAPVKASGRAFKNMAETMWHGVSAEQAARNDIPRTLSSRTDNLAAKSALTALEIPDRLNSGVDQFFRTLTEDWAATRLAQKQARESGVTLRSPEWAETVAKNLETIRDDPSKFPEIEQMAGRVTFSEEPGGVVKWLEEGKRKYPNLLGVVMPFIRTPANIASRAVDLSPFGIVRTAAEVATGAGRGRANISTRLRDNMVGTGAAVWAYDQATQGNITGAGPDDTEKRAELRATGWRPYSIKVGGSYWSYANFAPFSLALSAGAAAHEAQKYAKPGKSDMLSLLSDGAARTGKVVMDMTVLAGLGAVMKSLDDPDRYGTQWLSTALTQLMPAGSLLNTIGQATDEGGERRAERDTFGNQVMGSLAARLPDVLSPVSPIGTRQDVPVARQPLGEPVPNNQQGIRALDPTRSSPERPDRVYSAFLNAGVDIGAPPKTIQGQDAMGRSAPMTLTPAQQAQYQVTMGREVRQRMVPVQDQLPMMPKAEQQKRLQTILQESREAAAEQFRAGAKMRVAR